MSFNEQTDIFNISSTLFKLINSDERPLIRGYNLEISLSLVFKYSLPLFEESLKTSLHLQIESIS